MYLRVYYEGNGVVQVQAKDKYKDNRGRERFLQNIYECWQCTNDEEHRLNMQGTS